jgi:hypothetical protein
VPEQDDSNPRHNKLKPSRKNIIIVPRGKTNKKAALLGGF